MVEHLYVTKSSGGGRGKKGGVGVGVDRAHGVHEVTLDETDKQTVTII